MKILAVDWGQKKIGLAVSESGVLARELPEIDASVEKLISLIKREKPDRLVIGLPTTPTGEQGPQAHRVRSFGTEIAQSLGIPVEYEDEAFTTDEAQRLGGSHSLAARLILEQFLNKKR